MRARPKQARALPALAAIETAAASNSSSLHAMTALRVELATHAFAEITAHAQLLRRLVDEVPCISSAGLCGPALCARIQELAEAALEIVNPDPLADGPSDEELTRLVRVQMPGVG